MKCRTFYVGLTVLVTLVSTSGCMDLAVVSRTLDERAALHLLEGRRLGTMEASIPAVIPITARTESLVRIYHQLEARGWLECVNRERNLRCIAVPGATRAGSAGSGQALTFRLGHVSVNGVHRVIRLDERTALAALGVKLTADERTSELIPTIEHIIQLLSAAGMSLSYDASVAQPITGKYAAILIRDGATWRADAIGTRENIDPLVRRRLLVLEPR